VLKITMTTSIRVLAAAFVAVVAAYFAAMLLVQRSVRVIDTDAARISRDAGPDIRVISDLRAELREMHARVIEAIEGDDEARHEVMDSRRRVDDLFTQASALPADEREAALLAKLQSALRAFNQAAERALEQGGGGHRDRARKIARGELRSVGDSASLVAKDLVAYNVVVAESAAQRIEAVRARGSRIAWQLSTLCALLAALAALVTVRVMKQVQRVQQQHNALMQRKAEELEEFAARVAHDVVSPLSSVSMALSVIERHPSQSREALGRAHASLSRVRGIVDGLFEFARAGAAPEADARSEVRAVATGLVEELRPFAAQRQATLQIDDLPDCAVVCSPGVLLSVLGNLLRNGLKYLGNAEIRQVLLRARRRRGRVLFEVEDTGPGIPAELGARIFEPYIRGADTGIPGLGLGLATVKRLVESHGGSLGVRASPSGGALFWFELDEAPPANDDVSLPDGLRTA
jgi:signal transduction histidine kinase